MGEVLHWTRKSSWWNGTVTAMCGHVADRRDVQKVWFKGPTCPGCKRAMREENKK